MRPDTLQKEHTYLFRCAAAQWYGAVCPKIKESSAAKYHNMLEHYLLPHLGDVSVEEITFARIEALSTQLLSERGIGGRKLSPKTVSDLVGLLHSILRYAAKNGYPVPHSTFGAKIKTQLPRMRVLTIQEQERLCRYLRQNPSNTSTGILLALFTGMRIGEVCALRWEDISLSEGVVSVRRTIQRIQRFQPEGPKTKVIMTVPKSPCSIRQIPLPQELLDILTDDAALRRGFFLTGNEERWIEPRTLQNHFKRAASACGIPDVNFHALRHTFATRCVELGFDAKTLSEILGHSSVTITMNRYVHPTMEMKRDSMQRLAKWLNF